VALLENLRFVPGEEANDAETAERLAACGDFYVNDAFGAAHRAHASTAAVAALLKPAVAGFLVAKELAFLSDALDDPARPFVSVLGGAKISGKIDVIDALLGKVDRILIGGAMACTFFLAQDLEMGESLVEPDKVDLAKRLLDEGGERLVIPTDVVVARELDAASEHAVVAANAVEPGWRVVDIGPETVREFADVIRAARTVVWNGPMGVFEMPPFDEGTIGIAQALGAATDAGATTIVGGGDSAAAVARVGLGSRVSHVSTGGGASLELLEGKVLPGIAALDDA
jgi:phosphoglycerate kinase